MSLQDRTAIVTGASRGIGLAVAQRLVASGGAWSSPADAGLDEAVKVWWNQARGGKIPRPARDPRPQRQTDLGVLRNHAVAEKVRDQAGGDCRDRVRFGTPW